MTTTHSPKLAVVGCGSWGTNLVRIFAELEVLHAVVDKNLSSAQQSAKAHNAKVLDWQTTLADRNITAIALSTPAHTHADMAVEALRSGKHVFIEKPLALSMTDAQRVCNAKEETGKTIVVGHLFHYHPAFTALKSMVDNGKLGRIRTIHANRLGFGRIRHEEDALWSLAPHDISMVLGLLGRLPVSLEACGSNSLRPDIADTAIAHLQFVGGVDVFINVSWLHPQKERKLVVVGERATAVFDDCQPWEKKLLLFHNSVRWENGLPRADAGDSETVALGKCEPLAEECRHFLDCSQTGKPPMTGAHEALLVVRVLSAMSLSRVQSRKITLESFDRQKPPPTFHVHDWAIIHDDCVIGENTHIWHFCNIQKGARIGRNCIVGQHVMIDQEVKVGDNCKIQHYSTLPKAVTLEDGVFVGPHVVFTNVTNPRAEVNRKSEFKPTVVRRGATIGGNATIICGNELGEYCMVGASTVVTRSVPPYALVVGSPWRQIGWVSAAGERLGPDLVCPRTGERYRLDDRERLVPMANKNSMPHTESGKIVNTSRAELIPLVDLKAQRNRIKRHLDQRMAKVFENAEFIMGPEVGELEKALQVYTGAAHAVSCASGTDAITLALMALGLRPGDAVLVPTLTFVATIEPVALLGATPVLVDVEPDNLTIDASLIDAGVELALRAGKRPVGIIAVDLFGHPANYDVLNSSATAKGLWVLSDAAQSFGGSANGLKVGRLANVTTTSFFPSKPLGCYGDGGAVLTNDASLAEKVRSLRMHGRGNEKYDNVAIGLNSRLDSIQAAVLLEKLKIFDDELRSRQSIALRYNNLLSGYVEVPKVRKSTTSAWASYTVRSKERDGLQRSLRASNISTAIYYPSPLHKQPAYASYPVVNGTCPVAELAAREVLSLPMHPYLDAATQELVAASLQTRKSSHTTKALL